MLAAPFKGREQVSVHRKVVDLVAFRQRRAGLDGSPERGNSPCARATPVSGEKTSGSGNVPGGLGTLHRFRKVRCSNDPGGSVRANAPPPSQNRGP